MIGVSWIFQDILSFYQKDLSLLGLTIGQAYSIVCLSVFLGWFGAGLSTHWSLKKL
jgi:hypothetical protein